MKAIQIKKFGSDAIELVDTKKPSPGKGQVLVKVFASSVNPFDIKLTQGAVPKLHLPYTLGGDIAGVVAELGEGVENFQVGNKVYGSALALAGATGGYAEYAAAPAEMLAVMPRHADFTQAAASVLVGVSAVQALYEHMHLTSGQKILIHGGAGGIGSAAVQIAKHLGAVVVATATGDGINYVTELGVDQVIDYQTQDFTKAVSDCDAVFDTVGGQTFEQSFGVIKKGGVIVSMLEKDSKGLAEQHQVTAITQQSKVTTGHLQQLAELIDEGVVKIHVDKIFTLDTIKEAFLEKEQSQVLGKIAIQIQNP